MADPAYPPPQGESQPPPQQAPPPQGAPPASQMAFRLGLRLKMLEECGDSQPNIMATTTVVVTQPVAATQTIFRDVPVIITDSKGQQVQTVLEYRNGLLTWLLVGIVCLFTFWAGCCCLGLIPLFIDATKDVYHISPTDNTVVGVYKRI